MGNWIVIPSVLVPLILLGAVASRFLKAKDGRSGFNQKYDPKTGIGRGAPGFQTGVKRLAVTPEIAARLRAGENVSQEEIEASIAKAQAAQKSSTSSSSVKVNPNVDNDWLPAGHGQSPRAASKKSKRGGA
ncbi:uncharacterized protein PFL1_00074 [Pseudozyma flocculosa PF-1]|uniref:Uncharacterized protein n=1 Tax=Pseudozyma flocculosa TaxID=84751 RepID=A0A5C3ETQ8_9BASI|nr:uncharacterized protein PFL1_00074 [Pseudozyma flocculosa PF-1]EPQ31875.1 hypothetical protein PFL1_00074 [Pseudozyma flocculosa PF-1]SPO35220.1 uncharacterized protein PSFLO_00691 [Pseudozyma flocculosa]